MTTALQGAELSLAEAMWRRYRRGADDVLEEVARLFQITVPELISGSRRALLVDARSVVAVILRGRDYSWAEIGAILGGRDHSSIIHLVQRVQKDHDLKALADELVSA